MVMSPIIKRLLLVAFLLLCFISTTARARSLRENKIKEGSSVVEKGNNNNDDQHHQFKPKQNKQGLEQDIADLATMDYTPAAKNPPIHN